MAVNAYVLVVVTDPCSEDGMLLSQQLLTMWQQQYPVRIGEGGNRYRSGVCCSSSFRPRTLVVGAAHSCSVLS